MNREHPLSYFGGNIARKIGDDPDTEAESFTSRFQQVRSRWLVGDEMARAIDVAERVPHIEENRFELPFRHMPREETNLPSVREFY